MDGSKEKNCSIAYILGEGFYVHKNTIVKILSNILVAGMPDKIQLQRSLIIQIKQRQELLAAL